MSKKKKRTNKKGTPIHHVPKPEPVAPLAPPVRLSRTNITRIALTVLVVAGLIRMFFITNPGFEADVAFWKSWGLAPLDHGVVWSMHNTNNNYPTPFAYVLRTLVWIYSLFADPHNYYEFWQNTNVLFLVIAKLPSIISDFLIFGIFYWIGRHAKKLGFPALSVGFYLMLGSFYLLNPISIIDGAWWGQVDSVGVLIFLFSFMALLYKKPFLAGFIYITAMMTKLQNMIYGPLYFLFIWQMLGYRGLMRAVAGVFVGFFGLNIEFFLARDMNRVFQSLTENYDYFPLMSLNAYNPWWIVSAGEGMKMSDKLLAIGVMNAKKVGLAMFSTTYLFAVLHLITPTLRVMWQRSSSWTKKIHTQASKMIGDSVTHAYENPYLGRFFISLCVVASGFFLFQTESHDRYAFPLSVFLLLVAPFLPGRERKLWLAGYWVWSILYFFNLHSALASFYAKNAIPLLTALITPTTTIATAVLLTGMFFLFLAFLWNQFHWSTPVIALTFLGTMLLLGNASYLMGKPIYLSSLAPFYRIQDWGRSVEDKAGSSGRTIEEWHRLSVQYYFYDKGIGTHANSTIRYDIGGLFSRLTTDIGVDTQGGPQGDVAFQVWGDGKMLFASEPIGRYEKPRHASVDVTGVKTLELIVTDADGNNTDDHADWLNTKLWR